jgi:hypothetical protein
MPMVNPQGVRWVIHSRQQNEMLSRWFQGDWPDGEFPVGTFAELKRQCESATRKALKYYDLLNQLKSGVQADPKVIQETRDQFISWNNRQRKLMLDRKRAISQIKAMVRREPICRPGQKWVFTEDDVRWVPEYLLPSPGSPEREGYEVISDGRSFPWIRFPWPHRVREHK